MELFVFKSAEEYLGIEAHYVYRVVEEIQITPVPMTPPYHLGLIYYRGELFEVIDIVGLLGSGKAEFKGNPRIILLKWSDKKLALISDRISGLLWIEDGKGRGTIFTEGNHSVRLVTPEHIWSKLLKLPYGPSKISKDLQSGVG
ncbi:MAG: chemotaxis protein CheW [Deltaproteobacteria bacterium]|nr:chemotaxis protein CheW [Deltaproteobacteria bacterium]MBW1738076.1 chemotaxis protein CheW [Deltaproteobacteria bacterium]MBW1909694.1 chemotaxis protein CheW [Deltaproteobacteria bacterium]MBW2035489.1 chemotaxis protein CheW [Deltaproteobacteria bacterium]MBW2113350.1 chemotaxis protein CheW [Deltaproteobacteria bacterium]